MGMSCCLRKTRPLLKLLVKASPSRRKTILQAGGKDVIYSLCECCKNILEGNVELTASQKSRLSKYKTPIRKLADRRVTLAEKQHILNQQGGFIGPLLTVLAPILGGLLGSR
jgi:hypothetical protein